MNQVWDAMSGQEILTLKGHTGWVMSVTFTSDGKRLVSASYNPIAKAPGEVKVWDATSGQETLTLKGHSYGSNNVAISPDGKWLASGEVGTITVWDATSGQETLKLKGHTGQINSVAFSADGKRLASASSDRTLKVWDLPSSLDERSLKKE